MADIIRYWDVIPRHPNLKWKTRTLDKIDHIIIHQTASKYYVGTKDIDAEIRYFTSPGNHIAKAGCPYAPYHVMIDDDGKIYWLNPFEDITWHAIGFNERSIGIALMGSFNGPSGFKGKDGKPNEAQINSLIEVLNGFKSYTFNNIEKKDVMGHCEVDPIRKPDCPGTDIMSTLKQWRLET